MRISFDLDGVLCDTDNAVLGLLHNAERKGMPGAYNDLFTYYARRQVRLNPRLFVAPQDIWYIITGRVPQAHEVTQRWVRQHFPEIDAALLVMIGTDEIARMYADGQDAEAVALSGICKCNAVLQNHIDIHFDNNIDIVDRMRDVGIKAILYGGGVAPEEALPTTSPTWYTAEGALAGHGVARG